VPTYEYRCRSCGTHVEVVQAFTDDALTTCDACGGDLRKVFGSVGISFKGSGFYKNDSRGKASSTATAGGGADSSGGSASSEASSTSDTGSSGEKDTAKKAPSDSKVASTTSSGSTSSGTT
jgi:putative FmdB family regulatory protein